MPRESHHTGIRTQLSGKYSPMNPELFETKNLLTRMGVEVLQPIGNSFTGTWGNTAITFDAAELSLAAVEMMLFSAIKSSPVHIVCNGLKEGDGYIGHSAGVELAYAMVHERPVILLHPPAISSTVPPPIADLIYGGRTKFVVENLCHMSDEAVLATIALTISQKPDYGLDIHAEIAVAREIGHLFDEYTAVSE